MGEIMLNTEINAPGYPCEIVRIVSPEEQREFDHEQRSPAEVWPPILVQSDWDFPGYARAFGWSMEDLQRCRKCGEFLEFEDPGYGEDDAGIKCGNCGRKKGNVICAHLSTDGTVDCPECRCKAGDFISAAGDFLRENDGATAEDPGYFDV